mgnify:CR=1 FL=1
MRADAWVCELCNLETLLPTSVDAVEKLKVLAVSARMRRGVGADMRLPARALACIRIYNPPDLLISPFLPYIRKIISKSARFFLIRLLLFVDSSVFKPLGMSRL